MFQYFSWLAVSRFGWVLLFFKFNNLHNLNANALTIIRLGTRNPVHLQVCWPIHDRNLPLEAAECRRWNPEPRYCSESRWEHYRR